MGTADQDDDTAPPSTGPADRPPAEGGDEEVADPGGDSDPGAQPDET
jgi:hypothetical protein